MELNKHILPVIKWLDDPKSVSKDELLENRKAAYAAYAAYSVSSASSAYAAAAAADACVADADAEYWVNKYFERSGENKQDYIDAIEAEKKPQEPESKEWVNGLPPVGCECEATWLELPDGGGNDFCEVVIKGYHGNEVWFSKVRGVDGYGEVLKITNCEFRPLKTEKEKEREAFIEKANLKVTRGYMVDQATGSNLMEIFGDMFDAGFKAPEGE